MICALHSGLHFPSTDCTGFYHSLQALIHLHFSERIAAMALLTFLTPWRGSPSKRHDCRGTVPPAIAVSRAGPWFNSSMGIKTASPQLTGERDSVNAVLLHWVFYLGD